MRREAGPSGDGPNLRQHSLPDDSMLSLVRIVPRRPLIALSLLLIALTVIIGGGVHILQRDRAALLPTFAAEQLSRLKEASVETASELEDVVDDLRFISHLLTTTASRAEQERELTALLTVVKQYRQIVIYDEAGGVVAAATDPLADLESVSESFEPLLHAAARVALAERPGVIHASTPLDAATSSRLRAFSMRYDDDDVSGSHPSRAIAILVDTTRFFRKLRVAAASGEARIIVVGPFGDPCPPTDPRILARLSAAAGAVHPVEDIRAVLQYGEERTLTVSPQMAEALGLESGEHIAAIAPIRPAEGPAWAVATLRSTEPLRVRQRDLLLRLGLGSAAVALCLLGFGIYMVRESRRAIAVQERLKHADYLAHAHEKTEKILDHVPAGVMVLTECGQVAATNRFLRERTMGGALQVLGRPFETAFENARPNAVDRLRNLLEAAERTGHTASVFGEHLNLFGSDGQYSIHVVPLEPRFPDARHLVVIEDLSEVDRLTSDLLRAEKLATVGVLAAGIAHEIGTPLGVIRARAELLLSRLGGDHPQAGGLHVILEQIDWTTRTIRQLLDFSRPKTAFAPATDLAPVAESVAELLRFEFERKTIHFDCEFRPDLPRLAADADQLQQVLVNLFMNACDACARGGRIRVRATPEAGRVRIDIEDNGCGIPEDLRLRVFDPFFTTKKRGRGTGLGLTIAAQIVKSHGGQIDLQTQPQHGTTVSVAWPVHHPSMPLS